MDFQSLRPGSAIYILHRDDNTPRLIVASVQNKPEPKPRYMTQTPGVTPNPAAYAGTNMMAPVVEVIARCEIGRAHV